MPYGSTDSSTEFALESRGQIFGACASAQVTGELLKILSVN
jgi:hypothetical protein